MHVELLQHTNIGVAIQAIRTCYDSQDGSDSGWHEFGSIAHSDLYFELGEKDSALLRRILSSGHLSTIEHLVYTFDIDGISRGCLQELARHRIASLSVKSTRYTLGRIKDEREFYDHSYAFDFKRAEAYLVYTGYADVDARAIEALDEVRALATKGVPNDQLKYALPESFKTSLVWTINARSLRNFLELRLNKRAHWEIRKLAETILETLPAAHRILFEDLYQPER